MKKVVHAAEVVDPLVEGDEEGGGDGDAPGEEHPLPLGPLEVEETLHGELSGVGARHGGGLAGRQHAHRPHVHGRRAVGAPQEHAAAVQVRRHRHVRLGQEGVGV